MSTAGSIFWEKKFYAKFFCFWCWKKYGREKKALFLRGVGVGGREGVEWVYGHCTQSLREWRGGGGEEAKPSLKWSGTAELVRLWNGMEGEGVYSFFSRVVVVCAKGRGGAWGLGCCSQKLGNISIIKQPSPKDNLGRVWRSLGFDEVWFVQM